MLNRKANLSAIFIALTIAFTACTKQDVSPSHPANGALLQQSQSLPNTNFGLMVSESTIDEVKAQMNEAGINLIRIPVFLSQTTIGRTVNSFLQDGYNVQVNLNWLPTSSGPVAYPKDLNKVRQQAEAFFKYYTPYRSQMPFVVIENEWDNPVYHTGNIQDYLNELSAVTDIAHKYGFKVADAGITSSALQRWTYSQLTGDAAAAWRTQYYVGLHNNYDQLKDLVNTYIAGVKKINIDYSNVHWYNSRVCNNGFGSATEIYMRACTKPAVVCNEFGIRTNSTELFDETVNEITGHSKFGVAYSGTSSGGQAVRLTSEMLDAL